MTRKQLTLAWRTLRGHGYAWCFAVLGVVVAIGAVALPVQALPVHGQSVDAQSVHARPVHAQSSASQPGTGLAPAELFDVAWHDLSDFYPDISAPFIGEATSHANAPIYHLQYVVESSTRVTARMELRIVNGSSEAWTDLWFHLFPNLLGGRLDVTEIRVDGAAAALSLEDSGALMSVALPEELPVGRGVVVTMSFAVVLPTGAQRNYSLLSYRDGIMSLAHAYPVLAVHRGAAGWDRETRAPHGDLLFGEASWFRVQVDAPADLELVASGIETSRGAEPDGGADAQSSDSDAIPPRRIWTIRAGPVRDLYLSLGPYRVESRTIAGTTVRSHFLVGGREAARAALDQAAHALRIFGARWTPYPYRTLDLVPLRTQALGIEFPGIIALSRQLYADGSPSLEPTVVHEVAHQWFYGLVGNDQVSHPWLDEALAQYAVWVYARERYGDPRADAVLRAFAQRWRGSHDDVPIGLPVTAYTPAEYGSVVYGRGPLVINELMETMGEYRFDAFLRGYVAALRWRIATPEAFQRGAEAACACSLETLFEAAIATP